MKQAAQKIMLQQKRNSKQMLSNSFFNESTDQQRENAAQQFSQTINLQQLVFKQQKPVTGSSKGST